MESVALFLQTKATSYPTASRDFDLFGRSSFNRYYYATYLQVRALLGSLNKTWATAQHSSIPELLVGQVLERITRQRRRAQRLNDRDAIQICGRAKEAVHSLATLMKTAYAVRVTADYSPEIAIIPDNHGRFQLNLVSVTTAHDWPDLAQEYGQRIRRAWNLADE